jgi:hypothetical protein
VKENQPKLREAIHKKLAPAMFMLQHRWVAQVQRAYPQVGHARQRDKAHGRIECRDILTLPVSAEALNWPHAGQIALVRRQRQVGRQSPSVEYAAFVTSLSPREADSALLLSLTRDHWSIENSLFHTRDVTFGEDACRIRKEHAPQNLAALRNAGITLLNAAGYDNKAAAQRRFAAHPHEALHLIAAAEN